MAKQDLEVAIADQVTQYVATRAAALGLKPDATLSDPTWKTLWDEATANINIGVFWAKVAVDIWTTGNGPLADILKAAPTGDMLAKLTAAALPTIAKAVNPTVGAAVATGVPLLSQLIGAAAAPPPA